MGTARKVTYSQWLEFINEVKQEGLRSNAFSKLKICYPQIATSEYYGILLNELAKLETFLLKRLIGKFQRTVNSSIENYDLETFQGGMKEFKRNINNCFFFWEIEEYPFAIKKELVGQLVSNLIAFVDEYEVFLKKAGEYGDGLFFEDLEYMCKKAKLKKYIEGFRIYG